MKASTLYRTASVLMLLFAVLHGLSFRQHVPEWNADTVIASMQAVHFNAIGFDRTYWDFFSGFGFLFSVFLAFASVLAWQLAGPSADPRASFIGATARSLTVSFIAVTAVASRYAFTIPLVFSIVITALLIAALWRSRVIPGQ